MFKYTNPKPKFLFTFFILWCCSWYKVERLANRTDPATKRFCNLIEPDRHRVQEEAKTRPIIGIEHKEKVGSVLTEIRSRKREFRRGENHNWRGKNQRNKSRSVTNSWTKNLTLWIFINLFEYSFNLQNHLQESSLHNLIHLHTESTIDPLSSWFLISNL